MSFVGVFLSLSFACIVVPACAHPCLFHVPFAGAATFLALGASATRPCESFGSTVAVAPTSTSSLASSILEQSSGFSLLLSDTAADRVVPGRQDGCRRVHTFISCEVSQ